MTDDVSAVDREVRVGEVTDVVAGEADEAVALVPLVIGSDGELAVESPGGIGPWVVSAVDTPVTGDSCVVFEEAASESEVDGGIASRVSGPGPACAVGVVVDGNDNETLDEAGVLIEFAVPASDSEGAGVVGIAELRGTDEEDFELDGVRETDPWPSDSTNRRALKAWIATRIGTDLRET